MPNLPTFSTSDTRLCVIGEADPFLASLLQRFAQKSGLRIRRAQTGESVLDLARREKPVVVILDPDLPGKLRGWEAIRSLGNKSPASAIPVVVCTWLTRPEVRTQTGGEYAYLQKPDLHYAGFVAALEEAGLTLYRG